VPNLKFVDLYLHSAIQTENFYFSERKKKFVRTRRKVQMDNKLFNTLIVAKGVTLKCKKKNLYFKL
jgi:hypothetical protein